MDKIALFLRPPVFEETENNRQSYILYPLLFSLVLVFVVGCGVGAVFVLAGRLFSAFFFLPGVLFGVVYGLNRRGQATKTSYRLGAVLWLAGVLGLWGWQGINSADMMFYVAGTVAAGLVVGSGAAVWYAVTAVFATIHDEVKQIKASEERYRLVTNTISDYTFSAERDEQGQLHQNWVAGAFERMTGYTLPEFVAGGEWAAVLHPEDREKDRQDLQQLLQNRRVVTEVRIIRKDGVVRWVRVYAHPVWDEKKQILTGIYGAVQDITEKKQIEEALERERSLLRTVIDSLPDYIYLKDINNRCLVSNLANAKALGVSRPEEVEGKSLQDFYAPEEAERYNALDRRILETGESPFRQEDSFIDLASGRRKWTWMTRTLLQTGNGRIVGIVGIDRDITAYKEAEMEREKLIGDLQAKNMELERFTYTVSHDLKSPLITINGFLGFLERDAALGQVERLKQDVEQIRQATHKMRRLLDDLLELSRIGRLMNPPQSVAFAEIVQEALQLVQGRLNQQQVTVEVTEGLPNVFGDRARLVAVVQNLVDNAAKYMGDQPRLHIAIGMQQQEGETVLFVRDNGMGILPEHHQKVFDLFNKLDPQSEGTGIGLALVKRIVELHNGRIWLESAGLRQGSTFYFTLETTPGQ